MSKFLRGSYPADVEAKLTDLEVDLEAKITEVEVDLEARIDTLEAEPGSSAGLGESIEVITASSEQSSYGNGVTYVPLRQGQGDTLEFQFVTSFEGDIEILATYRMSAANGGDVELQFDHLVTALGEDPTTAVTSETAFTVTPGNDALLHEASIFTLTVAEGSHVYGVIERPTGGDDTHTGDMQILQLLARVTSS